MVFMTCFHKVHIYVTLVAFAVSHMRIMLSCLRVNICFLLVYSAVAGVMKHFKQMYV